LILSLRPKQVAPAGVGVGKATGFETVAGKGKNRDMNKDNSFEAEFA
jgi:hypothetical protein